MKKLVYLLSALLAVMACHEVYKAPKPVQDSFEAMFPGATNLDWEKEMGLYKAEFDHDGHEKEAWFSAEGEWSRTETEVRLSEVPETVLNTAREWCDWEIEDVFFCERADGGQSYYKFEFEKDFSDREKVLHVRPNGSIMSGF